MAWTYLLIAGMLEVGWALGMKLGGGFTRSWTTFFTILGMIASFYFLGQALKAIPIGTGYAVWTGIGAVGTAIAGIVLFGESAALPRLACICLIVAGIIGLRITAPLLQ